MYFLVVAAMMEPKQDNLEKYLQNMIATTKLNDNLNKMMKTTRSFDEELEHTQKQTQQAISDAFAKMINLSYELEHVNAKEITNPNSIPDVANNKLASKFVNRLSKLSVTEKFKLLFRAFKRKPQIVIKYFLGMIFGRILAIILYIVAAFIPAIPLPESMTGWIGKPLKALGSAVVSMRGFVADPSMIVGIVTNIPTDINKLLQKIGEFFQHYGRRVWFFIVRTVKHPKLAYEDLVKWSRQNAKFFIRICRSAMALTCSFVMIKLAMIFLLPLFGGIAITILGLKISVLMFVVVRMIFDKVGEFIGAKVFSIVRKAINKLIALYRLYRMVRQTLKYW